MCKDINISSECLEAIRSEINKSRALCNLSRLTLTDELPQLKTLGQSELTLEERVETAVFVIETVTVNLLQLIQQIDALLPKQATNQSNH